MTQAQLIWAALIIAQTIVVSPLVLNLFLNRKNEMPISVAAQPIIDELTAATNALTTAAGQVATIAANASKAADAQAAEDLAGIKTAADALATEATNLATSINTAATA